MFTNRGIHLKIRCFVYFLVKRKKTAKMGGRRNIHKNRSTHKDPCSDMPKIKVHLLKKGYC